MPGDEDQAVDPLIAAAEGAGLAPAYRGLAYAVFEDLQLEDFGNRIPSLTFEVMADAGPVAIGAIAEALGEGAIAAGETPALAGYAASGDSVRGAIEALADVVPLSLSDDGGAAAADRDGRRAGARSARTRNAAGASWSGAAPGRCRARSASLITRSSATIRPGCSGRRAAKARGRRSGWRCRRRFRPGRRRRWPSIGWPRSGPGGRPRRCGSAGGGPGCGRAIG